MGFVKRENHINTLESPSSISITQLRNENRRRRLEQVLDQPGLKVEDVVVAVGDKEVEEQIRKLVDAAVAEPPHTAAVCIYPKFVGLVRRMQKDQPERYPRALRVCTAATPLLTNVTKLLSQRSNSLIS